MEKTKPKAKGSQKNTKKGVAIVIAVGKPKPMKKGKGSSCGHGGKKGKKK